MITAGKIFPYDVLSELPIKVTSIELTDSTGGTKTVAPNAIKNSRLPLYVLGSESPNWREASFSIECEVSSADMSKVATDEAAIDFVVALRDGGTRSRWSVVGSKVPGSARWIATVSLPRSSLRGVLELCPFLARRSDGPNATGTRARHRGAIIGWATPISVYVDEPASFPISGDVDVHWVSFAEDPLLSAQGDRMFDVDVFGARPVVKLNKDHEELRRAMTNKSRQGPQAALRQALFCYVVQSVFMSITFDALEGARIATEEADGVATFPDVEWKADALRRVLRHLYSALPPEAGLKQLLDIYCDHGQMAHVVGLLSSALQSTINVKKNLLKLLGGAQ